MENIVVEHKGRAALIRLNRPDKLNALSSALFAELNPALAAAEANDKIAVIVLIGMGRAFAAGADIAEMSKLQTYAEAEKADFITAAWEQIPACRKPVIAAVNGFALGGGCELAMMCDIILAGESAKFGQPEITLGFLPGAGGSQRLTRAVGKAKAMEMCLAARMISAQEAERANLVSRVVADDKLEEEALALANKIGEMSLPALRLVKEAVNAAFETPLTQGIRQERRLFYSAFGLQDRREGMAAFLQKRKPNFADK